MPAVFIIWKNNTTIEKSLEEFNEQAEETVQKLVEAEAQTEFMRYAFLEEP